MAMKTSDDIHEQINTLLDFVQPVTLADERRREAFEVVKSLLSQAIPDCHCFLMGSFPLRTYLPDSDIDVAVLISDAQKAHLDTHDALRKILDALYCAAMQPERQEPCQKLRNINFVNAKTPVLRCTVGNIDLDLTVNQIGSLGAITFLEEADRFIGKRHLLKRSLLLVKLWLSAEAITYAGRPLLGAKHGMFSSYAVSVMVMYLFNANVEDSMNHPFDVLKAFLETFSRFPWDSCVLTLQGAVPIQVGTTVAKAVDVPASVNNRFKSLLQRFHDLRSDTTERDDSDQSSRRHFALRVCNIQDPLSADNNLTITITKSTLAVITTGLQHAYAHFNHVCMMWRNKLSVPQAHGNAQAAAPAAPMYAMSARPGGGGHPPTQHPQTVAFARGIAIPYIVHANRNDIGTQINPAQQPHPKQLQQQSVLSGQVPATLLPYAAVHPQAHLQSQPTGLPNIMPQSQVGSYLSHAGQPSSDSVQAHEPSLQRTKFNNSQEALQRCWLLRTLFPHSFQLYIMSGFKRPDMLDHPFQAFQGASQARPRVGHDLSHLRPATLDGDIEAMWLALVQASQHVIESAATSSQCTSPRDATNLLTSPNSCGIYSPVPWQNQHNTAIRAVDLFDLDSPATCSEGSPVTSNSDTISTADKATATDIRDADKELHTPSHTVDKSTQTLAEDQSQHVQQLVTATAPMAPYSSSVVSEPTADTTSKARKRRNKRLKSPARTHSSAEFQPSATVINAKAHAVDHLVHECAVASVATVPEPQSPSSSSTFQSHLFTMVWSCMVCILLMHFRLLEFSSGQPEVTEKGCTTHMTASTTHAAPSCGECVCPRQAALPHWLRLNASLSLGDVAAEPGLSYQWVKDGFQIAGATNSFFHIRNATHEHAGVYECIVRNATALTSRVIPTILRVGRPPHVKLRTIMQSLAVGQTLVLDIEAEGLPSPQYQWRRNGVPIPGATSNILVVPSVTLADAGTYTCEIFNIAGRTLWEEATIAVNS